MLKSAEEVLIYKGMCGTMQLGRVCLYIQWLKIAYGHIWTLESHLTMSECHFITRQNIKPSGIYSQMMLKLF